MELRHLRYFVAVAEELHFGRAANRLQIAQPPLSQQIRKLEAELGVRLFARTKRSVQLTDPGRVLLAEARQILSRAERAAENVKRADRGQVGPLVVACGPIAVHTVLAKVLASFRGRFPEVDVSLRECVMGEAIEALREKSANVALVLPYFHSEVLEREIILSMPMLAAVSKTHPLAGRRRIRLKQLADQRFVLYSLQGYYEHCVALCQGAGFTPQVAQLSRQLPTLLALVAAGYGVSLVPALLRSMAGAGVAFLSVRAPRPTLELCMTWRSDDSSPVVGAFRDTVRASLGLRRRPLRAS